MGVLKWGVLFPCTCTAGQLYTDICCIYIPIPIFDCTDRLLHIVFLSLSKTFKHMSWYQFLTVFKFCLENLHKFFIRDFLYGVILLNSKGISQNFGYNED